MLYYVFHPYHNGINQVTAGSPQAAAQAARGSQETGVDLTVYWGAHGSVAVAV